MKQALTCLYAQITDKDFLREIEFVGLANHRRFYHQHKFRFHNPLYAIDSTTIDLCLNLYDWAHYRKNKGAIKLHTQLDLSGNLPWFVLMSLEKWWIFAP